MYKWKITKTYLKLASIKKIQIIVIKHHGVTIHTNTKSSYFLIKIICF